MKYKLACIDMDGTLLNDKHGISEEDAAALREAVDKGITVAITTGRLFASAKYYASVMGIKVWIISSNGAYIREIEKEEPIYKCPLDREQFDRVCDVIEKYNLDFNFNTFDRVITDKVLLENNTHVIANKTAADNLKIKFGVHKNIREIYDLYAEGILKVLLFPKDDMEAIINARQEFVKLGGVEVVSSAANNLEIMSQGISKGEGIKRLAENLGIRREKTIGIGDSENDISMMKYAGFKVAMGNANKEVKAIADYVTDTNINSGVSKAMRIVL